MKKYNYNMMETDSVYKPLLCDFKNYVNFRNDIDDFIINQAKKGA